MRCWHNGQVLSQEHKVTTLSYGLHYPCSVWEGMRAYVGHEGQLQIFALEDHIERLFNSAKIMGFEIPFSKVDVMTGCKQLLRNAPIEDHYIRPLAYLNIDCRDIIGDAVTVNLDIYAFPLTKKYDPNGIKAAISHLPRAYPYMQMQAKAACNYGTLLSYEQEATRLGVQTMFIPNAQGHINESNVANIFLVKGNTVVTPPNNGDLLPGITRKVIIRDILLNSNLMFKKYEKSIQVAEKLVTRADIYTADEVFITGTFAEVTAITHVDGKPIGSGRIGILTQMLKQEYNSIVRS